MLNDIVRLWASTRLRPESILVLSDKAASGTQDFSRVSAGAGASWGLGADTLPHDLLFVGGRRFWQKPFLFVLRVPLTVPPGGGAQCVEYMTSSQQHVAATGQEGQSSFSSGAAVHQTVHGHASTPWNTGAPPFSPMTSAVHRQ